MMQLEENRDRMRAFIFLYVMGLNICQATGEDNSTQMYYATLIIDENAIGNITEILTPFGENSQLRFDDLKMTTTCKSVSADTECTCKSGYRWSDTVCQSSKKCCGNHTCTFPQNATHMCISNITVITGCLTMQGKSYYNCLADATSEQFKTCNDNLLEEMKKVYSTFKGFDDLHITKYSVGSIIAHFEMTIASNIEPQDLSNKSIKLASSLSASLNLETKGVVTLTTPENPVSYYSQQNFTCATQADLNTQPLWHLESQNKLYSITNGTQSNIITGTQQSSLTINNVTEVWTGVYKCTYCQKLDSVTISHSAQAVMNVSLLPIIGISVTPAFPNCQIKDLVKVTATCEIKKSYENYTVEWTQEFIEAGIIKQTVDYSELTVVYKAETVISCNSSMQMPQLTCTFTNRQNQTNHTSINIVIIHAGDKFCEKEGDWEVTKGGYTAVLNCKNAVGQRERKCKNDTTIASWEEEESECVNHIVSNVLESANAVGIGLGSLDINAAVVLKDFENVTNNTETIKGFANMKTSVDVLSTLSKKLDSISNVSAINDLLDSSSNLLVESLENSWEGKSNADNRSLAEVYLESIEKLIEMTHLTQTMKKANIEVAACNSKQVSKCDNSVLDVTVSIDDSDHGSVKTAGFRQLDKYLPHRDNSTMTNSIVVSTTTEKKKKSVQIEMKFKLSKPRPRDVMIWCVSWDYKTKQWSSDGCEWKGEGHCVCKHLSSFTILMSKYPIKLPGMNTLTLVGLSASVLSLIISIVIQLSVWNAVVKTSTLYIRHVVHLNISLCLLVGDCCFLASYEGNISVTWCKAAVVLKHFCYLSMFFWMLCLSFILLHQAVFVFHSVSKKIYLKCSLILGYVCPFLIVAITFLSYNGVADSLYFNKDTCWLVYSGTLEGSIHAFVIPVGIIVFINVFSMVVVIMKLLDHHNKTETSHQKDKTAAKTIIRTVILLTPIFGVTWLFGFGVMLLDLSVGCLAYAVNYAFALLNAFQGLFILLTTCLGDKQIRDTLLSRFRRSASKSISDSSKTLDSSCRK